MNDAALQALADCVSANVADAAWVNEMILKHQDEHIAELQERIHELEEEVRYLRGNHQ